MQFFPNYTLIHVITYTNMQHYKEQQHKGYEVSKSGSNLHTNVDNFAKPIIRIASLSY